jgi:hypothetical protein
MHITNAVADIGGKERYTVHVNSPLPTINYSTAENNYQVMSANMDNTLPAVLGHHVHSSLQNVEMLDGEPK